MNPLLLAESPQIIKEFLGYLGTIKGKSEKTVEAYYLDLRTFFRYMKQKRGLAPSTAPFEEILISDIDLEFIKTISLTDVYEYMNYLASVRHNKASTLSLIHILGLAAGRWQPAFPSCIMITDGVSRRDMPNLKLSPFGIFR